MWMASKDLSEEEMFQLSLVTEAGSNLYRIEIAGTGYREQQKGYSSRPLRTEARALKGEVRRAHKPQSRGWKKV